MTILKMSFASSFLIAFVLFVRAVSLKRLPKRALLFMWAVVICRLLIPFFIPTPFSVASSFQQTFISISPSSKLATTLLTETVPMEESTSRRDTASYLPDAPSPEESAFPQQPLILLWLAGAAGLAGYFTLTHVRTRRKYRDALPDRDEYVLRFLREHPIRRDVQVRRSEQVLSPLTYGLLRPVILLPKSDPPEGALPYILMHEHLHIRRFDVLKKYALAAALCIHWFNPLVWVMFFAANRDIELACDEGVLHTAGGDSRSAYAMSLIGMEERKLSVVASLCSHYSENAVETRIKAIMNHKSTKARRTLAVLLVLACLGGMTAVSAADTGSTGMRVCLFERRSTINTPELYLKSVEDKGDRLCAVIVAQCELSGTVSIQGCVWHNAANADGQTLFGLEGTLRKTGSGSDGMAYYEYDAAASANFPDEYPTISSCGDATLTLTVTAGSSFYTAAVPLGDSGKSSGSCLIVSCRQTLDDGGILSQIELSSSQLTLYGTSPSLIGFGTKVCPKFPDVTVSILIADGRRIDRNCEAFSGCIFSAESGGGSLSCDESTGKFDLSMDFRDLRAWKMDWALDLSQVTGIMINGKTYRICA